MVLRSARMRVLQSAKKFAILYRDPIPFSRMRERASMIGFYDYTVVATYISLLFGLMGIYSAAEGNLLSASVCLLLAGLLDAFDGRIARTKKNRSDAQKRFGIQIDSLNDVVCFGVLPAAIGAALGEGQTWLLTTMSFFALAALIRLAYFNVMEEERQSKTDEHRHEYLGVPVTASALVAPLALILTQTVGRASPAAVYAVMLGVLGVLYIAPIRVKKPGLVGILLMAVLGVAEFLLLLYGVMLL